jgi:bacteriorhodopsin
MAVAHGSPIAHEVAVQAIQVFDGAARFLGQTDHEKEEEFKLASMIAQIFSGVMFGALAGYLVIANTTRLSYIHRASIEKRLNFCCLLNAIVAALSAFLNFFQLTEVDNWALPGQRQFTVDTARPIEWILTCPLMQLSLVLMGGPRIPDVRRIIMPLLALITLLFGSATLFVDRPWIYVLWFCGLTNHCVAMFFNRQQIIEHSKGVEGLLSGDSEFRKATLILMGTWIPFPCWFALSPEGFGLITNIAVIQLGWAFLNITSKFTLTFYMQRIKDNYGNRLKVKRAVQQHIGGKKISDEDEDFLEDNDDAANLHHSELGGCVLETMTFLGMAENAERFLRLLKEARISNLDQVAALDRPECDQKLLPYDLITALQKRHKVWALEMVDDAEKGLEAGENYYHVGPRYKNKGSNEMTTIMPMDNEGSYNVPVGSPRGGYQSGQMPNTPLPMGTGVPQQKEPYRGAPYAQPNGRDNFSNLAGPPNGQSPPVQQQYGQQAQQQYVRKASTGRLVVAASGHPGPQMVDMEQSMATMLQDFQKNILEKVEGIAEDMGKKVESTALNMEKSQNLLEAKVVEITSRSQGNAAIPQGMNDHLEQFASKLAEKMQKMQPSSYGQKMPPSSYESSGSMDNKVLHDVLEKLEAIQQSQQTVVNRIGASFTDMTDQWAHQIIQESKVAAFTLQSKIVMMEESQNKKTSELEASLMEKIERLVKDKFGKFEGIVQERTVNMGINIDASLARSEEASMKLEQNLAAKFRELNSETTKTLEMGLGVFGNSLRSQIDTLQAAQLGRSVSNQAEGVKDSSSVISKLETLSGRTKEGFQKNSEKIEKMETNVEKTMCRQAEAIKDLKKNMEDTMRQQVERTQEVHTVMSSVVEEATGARTKATECSYKLSHVTEMLNSSQGSQTSPNWWSGNRQSQSGNAAPSSVSSGRHHQPDTKRIDSR